MSDYLPLAVAGVVIVVLLVGQPLSGDVGGLDLNLVGALAVAIGGILGTFD